MISFTRTITIIYNLLSPFDFSSGIILKVKSVQTYLRVFEVVSVGYDRRCFEGDDYRETKIVSVERIKGYKRNICNVASIKPKKIEKEKRGGTRRDGADDAWLGFFARLPLL